MIIILWRFKYLVEVMTAYEFFNLIRAQSCQLWLLLRIVILFILSLEKNEHSYVCNNIPIGAIPSLYGEFFFELRGETILTRFCTLLILFKEPNEAICSKNFSGSLNGSACLIIPFRKDLLRILPFGNLLIHMSIGLAISVLVVQLNKLTSLLPKIE